MVMCGNSTKTTETLLEIYINNLKVTQTAKTISQSSKQSSIYYV